MSTIDTRFLLTHFLADSETLKSKTKEKMIQLRRQRAIIPTIVLHEVYNFEIENAGKDVADTRINSVINSGCRIVDLTTKIALSSAELRCKHHQLPTADSIIAATAIETKATTIISDDPHFKTIKEINTKWIQP